MNGYEELRHLLGFAPPPHLEEALVVDATGLSLEETLTFFGLTALNGLKQPDISTAIQEQTY